MIKKIFIENRNDERTNALRLILDTEKIPYYFINEALLKDYETSLFLFTTQPNIDANYKIILNPELLERPIKLNQAERLKLKISNQRTLNILNKFELGNLIEIPSTDVYKEGEKSLGEPIAHIYVGESEHAALSKDRNTVYFFFDILNSFLNLISESYFEKKVEPNILSGKLGSIYKLVPYRFRLPIYRKYYKRLHEQIDNSEEYNTRFPIDPASYVLIDLIKESILLYTDLLTINKWPHGHEYAVLMSHDTEPTKFSYISGLKLLLDKLDEHKIKSTITLVGNYVNLIDNDIVNRLKQHELGCHGMYHDRKFLLIPNYEKKQRLEMAKKIIEETFNKEISFFRAPTLERPSNLFELLEEKEYKYDSSLIDVQREPPFCGKGNTFYLPFYPIVKNKKYNILEMSVTAPDCISPYFFGFTMEQTFELFKKKIEYMKEIHGLCVFIVHTPAWGMKDAENRLGLLDFIIKNTEDCWRVTFKEVSDWWNIRQNLFLEFKENKLFLINKNNIALENIDIKLENRENQFKEFNVNKIGAREKIVVK